MTNYTWYDLTGRQFGRLTALRKTGMRDRSRNVVWECRCDCGKTVYVASHSLVSGNRRSCGCLGAEASRRNGRVMSDLWSQWTVGEVPPSRFNKPAGSAWTPAQERNWRREINRVNLFEAKRTGEWLAQRGQRGERVA